MPRTATCPLSEYKYRPSWSGNGCTEMLYPPASHQKYLFFQEYQSSKKPMWDDILMHSWHNYRKSVSRRWSLSSQNLMHCFMQRTKFWASGISMDIYRKFIAKRNHGWVWKLSDVNALISIFLVRSIFKCWNRMLTNKSMSVINKIPTKLFREI